MTDLSAAAETVRGLLAAAGLGLIALAGHTWNLHRQARRWDTRPPRAVRPDPTEPTDSIAAGETNRELQF